MNIVENKKNNIWIRDLLIFIIIAFSSYLFSQIDILKGKLPTTYLSTYNYDRDIIALNERLQLLAENNKAMIEINKAMVDNNRQKLDEIRHDIYIMQSNIKNDLKTLHEMILNIYKREKEEVF